MADEKAKKDVMADEKAKTESLRRPDSRDLDIDDMPSQVQGNNQLHGNDQVAVHNQRHAVPDAKAETDGVVESFEKLEKTGTGSKASKPNLGRA